MTLYEIARQNVPEEQVAFDSLLQAHMDREGIPHAAAIWNDIADRITRGGYTDPLEYAI